MSGKPSDTGFTLLEMLVATAILVTVSGAIFALLNPARGVFQAQAEWSDVQQRLRTGIGAIRRELLMAGAGTYSGPAKGPLHRFFASVLPMRVGAAGADPPGSVRTDAITIVYVPATTAQTTVRDATATGADRLTLDLGPGCPAGDPLCRFSEGMRVLVFDGTGSSGVFTIMAAQAPVLQVRHRDGWPAMALQAGASIAEVASHTFYYDRVNLQLRHYDGHQTDLPLLDNVVDLAFEYFGDPQPPLLYEADSNPSSPWTTYGPRPPDNGIDEPADDWPPGENCVFVLTGSGPQPRLPSLGPPDGGLVRLTPSMLLDGPWCPDAAAANRYDADLLRIRRVRVTLRVQTGVGGLRGVIGGVAPDAMFRFAGTSRDLNRTVPDQEIHFDVTPRNLNLDR